MISHGYVSVYQRVDDLVLDPTIEPTMFLGAKDSEAASAGAESQQRGRRQVFRWGRAQPAMTGEAILHGVHLVQYWGSLW